MTGIEKIVFLGILCCAAGMDLKRKELSIQFLLVVGCIGILRLMVMGVNGEVFKETLLASSIGVMILGISRMTGGGIGEGDGWFFLVLGLFLSPQESIWLFLSGVILCGMFSLLYVTISIWNGEAQKQGKSVPFLPFLLPGGVWIALCVG